MALIARVDGLRAVADVEATVVFEPRLGLHERDADLLGCTGIHAGHKIHHIASAYDLADGAAGVSQGPKSGCLCRPIGVGTVTM